uniref:NAD-dependent epimerase/dehydratase tndE n=1 Tax=Aspergillus flavipes TaxID=41900 RepID=TNDE_ASPFV|nr:RecName: Full=NAD-dependent epimerase/dehydratase tndE; AltName: Full=Talaronoid C biosynthesis cluster protein E [Aspergillus flavipes]QVR97764.1 TndE [Aspergillus flavipes]
MQSTVVPPGGLVLITGVNGFLASHLALQLIQRGYMVKGTVRTAESASWITEAIMRRHPTGKFQAVVIPILSASGVMDDLVKDVDGIAYVAADTSLNPDPDQVITPGLEALKVALQSATQTQSVKRFVLTSSYTAAVDTFVPSAPDALITRDSWNQTSTPRAWAPPPYDALRALDVYQSLKTESETLFWKFASEAKPSFIQNSVLPGFVVGPIIHRKQRGSTAALVKAYFDDVTCNQAFAWISAPWVVDVVDNALLHLAGLIDEDVQNERLLALAEPFKLGNFARVFEQIDPSRSWPAGDNKHGVKDEGGTKWVADTKRSVAILQRLGQDEGFTPFLESVRRTCLDSDPAWTFGNFLPKSDSQE